MRDYTELIFGARLYATTPRKVIETLQYLVGDLKIPPADCDFDFDGEESFSSVFWSTTQYLDIPLREMSISINTTCDWSLSIRSTCRNHNREIERFLEWIKPYIYKGNGNREMYAIIFHEGTTEPEIVYLH